MRVRLAASTAAKIWFAACLLLLPTLKAETILVGADAEWRYYSSPTPPPEDWKTPSFNASTWSVGHAQLGYGDGDEATVIPGGNLTPRPVAAYFRRAFSVADSSTLSKLVLNLLRDDGAVIYLNGVEVARSNMPDGPVTPETLASTAVGADAENTFFQYEVPASALVAGENVVAVEVHQVNVSSTDISFALKVVGITETPQLPVLSIEATTAVTSEPLPNALVAPGVFTVRLTPAPNTSVIAWVTFAGTAKNSIDYESVANSVLFAPGQSEVQIKILPKSDDLIEGDETVVAELGMPPTAGAVAAYTINPEKRRAVVTIKDEDKPAQARIEITNPQNGAVLEMGATVIVKATAVDPDGYIPRVEFFADGVSIGVSQIEFVTPPAPGTPIEHSVDWKNIPAGDHVLTAKGVRANGEVVVSQGVTVHVAVVDPPPRPLVSIIASQPNTGEPGPTARYAPGKFTVKRTGSTDAALPVYLRYDGTATPGADYQSLPARIEIPAGQVSADLLVEAIADSVTEPAETVVAKIAPPPTSPDSIPYIIDAEHAAATVTIADTPTTVPTLSIVATTAITSEPLPNALVAPGVFKISRTGPTDTALTAWISLGGTAKNEIDYEPVSGQVIFAAGQAEVFIKILAKSDDLVEGDETVVAEIALPPTADPVSHYQADPERRRAVVTIKDEDPAVARIEITHPQNGAVLEMGTTVAIKATAVDPDGYIPRIEFFVDGASIGISQIEFITAPAPGTPIDHSVYWKNIPIGDHVLTAKGARANGEVVTSRPVTVHVMHFDPPPHPLVSIHAVPDPRLRPIGGEYTADWFEIRRTGSTNDALQVYFHVPQDGEHIATPEIDYKRLVSPITIAAGAVSVILPVDVINDELVEGPEIVRVELTPIPPTIDPVVGAIYQIDPEHASAEVTIHDDDEPAGQVILAVSVADGIASEVTATDALDTALFLIKRVGGPSNVPVTATYELSGTGQNGVDYQKLTGSVELAAGVMSAPVKITAIADNTEEGEETVILKLVAPVCVAIAPPPPECYVLGDVWTGRAVIVDRRDGVPGVKILHPVNGAVFSLGQIIEIEAQAFDREGIISKLEILFDGHSLDSTTEDHLVVQWSQGSLGDHTITARVVDGAGQVARAEIHVLIREQSADAFVFRKLPPAYTPGTPFLVELRAEPPAGARAYAVEDHPPTGWQVSSISNDGVFDPATGKVKFGPFTDTTARTLSYKVTPPATAVGRKEFSGVGSVDGVNYTIGGDRIIEQSPSHHPADTDNNYAINVAELTAYAAAWKRGDDVPLSYLTRAGFIWKRGEAYKFDGSHEPPFCWVPLQLIDDGGLVRAASVVECERSGGGETQPGVSANIQVRIAPPAGTSAYAVEEKVPLGWSVSNISHEGTFDATTGLIRWGMFFDATARTFAYTLTPPPGVTAVARLGGRVSFDGATYEISGQEKVTSTDSTTAPTIAKCESDGSKVQLELTGVAGQVGVLQTSTDLVHWQDVTTLYLPDGTVHFEDNASSSVVKYYRLQIR